MTRRYLYTGLGALVFLGLLAWVLTQERGRVAQQGEVFALQLSDVSAITVQGKSYSYSVQRSGQEWWFTSPFSGLLAVDRAKSLVEAVAALKGTRRDVPNPDDPQFGLAQPQMTVSITYRGDRLTTLSLGAQSPVGNRFFARLSDRPGLFLVDQGLQSTLDQDPQQMRDKRLIAKLEPAKVKAVTVQLGAEQVVVQQVPLVKETTWEITVPRALKADKGVVEGLVSSLQNQDAMEFLPYTEENLAACGLENPPLSVTYEVQDLGPVTVYLGREEQREVAAQPGGAKTPQQVVFAVRSGRPEILVFSAALHTELAKGLLELRDKHLLGVKQEADLTGLTVQREQGLSFKLMRSGVSWQVLSPRTGPANPSKVDDLLYALADLQALDYLVENDSSADLSRYGLKVPQAALTMTLAGGGEVTLAIGAEVAPQADRYYARLTDRSDVYLVAGALLRDLPTAIDQLVQANPPPGEQTPAPEAGGFTPPELPPGPPGP